MSHMQFTQDSQCHSEESENEGLSIHLRCNSQPSGSHARQLTRPDLSARDKELANGSHTMTSDETPTAAAIPEGQDESAESTRPSKVISRKTSQLPTLSKLIYHVDHYTSMSVVVMAFTAVLIAVLIVGAILGFPSSWVVSFEVAVSSVTLLMVFTIQHTQGREQEATQRKLDELLRATPGAAESLMLLEEAPKEFMIEVGENQREARADLVDDDEAPSSS